MRTRRLLVPLGLGLFGALALATRDAPAHDFSFDWANPATARTVDPAAGSAPAQATVGDEQATFGDETAALDEIPGEIAVDLRDDVSDADVADIDAKDGIVLRPASHWSTTHDKIDVADVDPTREPAILDALAHDPRVEHAEPMALYRAT